MVMVGVPMLTVELETVELDDDPDFDPRMTPSTATPNVSIGTLPSAPSAFRLLASEVSAWR